MISITTLKISKREKEGYFNLVFMSKNSIVLLFLIWLSFPAEVIGVTLLYVPSHGGIEDIIAPTHHFTGLNSS